MISNKELYEQIFVQYLHKGYSEDRADYITSRVVSRQRSHLRGQQSLVNGGWAPGNMDLAPLTNDGGTDDEAEKRNAQYNIRRKDPAIIDDGFEFVDMNVPIREQEQKRRR